MFWDFSTSLSRWVRSRWEKPLPAGRRKRTRRLGSHAEHLEVRLVLTPDLFVVPGADSAQVKLTFLLTQQQTKSKNEVGFYIVDDAAGSIDGQQPGTGDYARAVLHSSTRQILFPSGGLPGTSEDITLAGGTQLAFYLVKGRSSQDLLDRDHYRKFPKSPPIYFSADDVSSDQFDHVHSQVLPSGDATYQWQDQKRGKNPAFDDAVYTITASTRVQFFSDLGEFQAASTTSVVETFDAFTPTGTSLFSPQTFGDITITPLGGSPAPNLFIFPPGLGNGSDFGVPLTSNVLTANGNEDFELTFATPPTTVGFDTITNFSTTKPVIHVYDTNGLLMGTYSLAQAPDSAGFVGIISNVPIGQIRWTAFQGEMQDTAIDNIRVGTSNP
ncbi:MAG: hypothetical protein JWN70_3224 [Planctomycetaceae bacterium]|nr:hypothetical protein [Planctomycetaceae bacterium]